MKSKFNKLLLSTVFAGLCFGCFTPSFAEGQRDEAKGPAEAPAPENVGPKLPAPKFEEEAVPAPVEEGRKFSKIGDVERENKDGEGYFFYCTYEGGHRTVRGTVGNWSLEGALKGACMACLKNGVRSCDFKGCTVKDYYTDKHGDKRFDNKTVERTIEIDPNSANLACPISVKATRTDKNTGVIVGDEVRERDSIAALVPANPETQTNVGSYHYESGGSFESHSNGYYREKEYKYDSNRGGSSREIVIPPRPRFWGNGGGFFGPPSFGPEGFGVPKAKPEVIPYGKGRPEIDRRNPDGHGRPQQQEDRREERSENVERTRPI